LIGRVVAGTVIGPVAVVTPATATAATTAAVTTTTRTGIGTAVDLQFEGAVIRIERFGTA
jgi:mRNA-degrading endonuclease toxin of MazEF toxin-antitoxin module